MDVLEASFMSSRGTLFDIERCLVEKMKAYDTGYSKQVTQPSTNPARPGFTSAIGPEPAFSRWYGRRR